MVALAQGERAVLEFTYKHTGPFMFHAHQSEFAELGWSGVFLVQEALACLSCTHLLQPNGRPRCRRSCPSRLGATGLPLWFKGLAPLVLLAALVLAFLRVGPVGVFRAAFPPVEELTLERIRLPEPGLMEVSVVNGGPETVTIAQVMVDDANWVHSVNGSRTLERLERRTVRIPYPWVEGEPHTVTVVTSTGLTFSADVAVATQSPPVDGRYLGTFALLGVYAGVIPVFIGLLWLPFVRAVDRKWVDFFLSLTIGLLVFLGVDALEEALETAAVVPGAYQGRGTGRLRLARAPRS